MTFQIKCYNIEIENDRYFIEIHTEKGTISMARIKSNLSNDIFHHIVDRINKYVYTAGDTVSEVALAEEFGISRTPVREAILRLIDVGLLERNKTKIVVKALNLSDINEILDARLAAELMSVHIVFARGGFTKEDLNKLNALHETYLENLSTNNTEENFELDTKFHSCIIESSNNSRLIQFINRLNLESDRFRRITMLTPTRQSVAFTEHQLIIDTINSKNKQDILDVLMQHTKNSKENYRNILDNDTGMWIKMIHTLKN